MHPFEKQSPCHLLPYEDDIHPVSKSEYKVCDRINHNL